MFMNVCKLLITFYHVLLKIKKLHPMWNKSKVETSFKYLEQTFLQAALLHFLNSKGKEALQPFQLLFVYHGFLGI